MERRVILGVVLTLMAIIILAAYIAVEPQRQAAAAQRQLEESAERGISLYAGRCGGCHGATGEGSVGPALAGDAFLERRGFRREDSSALRTAEADMKKIIARGVPKTAMPAWGLEEGGSLNQEQILEIASFLLHGGEKEWRAAAALASPPSAGSQPAASAAATDTAAQGRQVYESKGCNACHGATAQGGVGPAIAGFDAARISKQVRTPKGAMPAYPPDRLSDDELKSLSAFIESLKQ